MLKLKLQYFGHMMQRAVSFEKTLMLGKIEGRRRRGWRMTRWLDGITDSVDMGLGGLWELVMDGRPGVLWFMGSQGVGHEWVTELNWTENIYNHNAIITSPNPNLRSQIWIKQRSSHHGLYQFVEQTRKSVIEPELSWVICPQKSTDFSILCVRERET